VGHTRRVSDEYIYATEYAQRLGIPDGIGEIPDWLPGLTPQFLQYAEELDATRDASGYGPASVAYAVEEEQWGRRPAAILWALLRHLLGQPGSAPIFAPAVVDGLRWAKDDALWIAAMAPVSPETQHLILSALEAVPAVDLVVAADSLARLRSALTTPELLERLDALDKSAATAPRPEDALDPRFVERIAFVFEHPIRELLTDCAVTRPDRPSWYWRDRMKRLAFGRHDDIREILAAIPAHLDAHGALREGQDVLRGLIFVAEAVGGAWVTPTLADVVRAAGATPVRSRVLANAAVTALYYRSDAKGTMRRLHDEMTDKTLRKRISDHEQYM